jgi:hypothetical protein
MKQINLLPTKIPYWRQPTKVVVALSILLLLLIAITGYFLKEYFLSQTPFSSPFNKQDLTQEILLSQHAITQLKMVGFIGHTDNTWALMQSPNGKITTIKVNDVIGREQAKVIQIQPTRTILKALNQPDTSSIELIKT